MGDVKVNVRKKTPKILPSAAPRPAGEPGIAPTLRDTLHDPLGPKAGERPAVAPALAARPEVSAPEPKVPTTPQTEERPALPVGAGLRPDGARPMLTLSMEANGHVPWGQIGHELGIGEGVPAEAKARVEAAAADHAGDAKQIEVVDDQGRVAIRLKDHDRMLAGGLPLRPPAATPADAADATEAAGEQRGPRDREASGRAEVADRLGAVVGAARGRLESLRQDRRDMAAEGGASAQVARTVRLAGAGRTLDGLRQSYAAMREQVAPEDGEAVALLAELDAVIAEVQQEIGAMRDGG